MEKNVSIIADKLAGLWPHLNERARRMVAATEARTIGYGGISQVSRACGMARVTIAKGIRDLQEEPLEVGRIRRAGAGRRDLTKRHPD